MIDKITPKTYYVLLFLLYTGASDASDPNYQCFVPGECIFSQHINIVVSKDEVQCLQLCKNNLNCTWFTFYPDDFGSCQLFSNCESIDDSQCPLCITGQEECSIPEPVCWVQGHCLGKVTHTESNVRYLKIFIKLLACIN